jgi:hypothetical protein
MTELHSDHNCEILTALSPHTSDSNEVRVRQLAMVERFKEISAQMGLDLAGDGKLFPPDDTLKKINMIWSDNLADPEQRGTDQFFRVNASVGLKMRVIFCRMTLASCL